MSIVELATNDNFRMHFSAERRSRRSGQIIPVENELKWKQRQKINLKESNRIEIEQIDKWSAFSRWYNQILAKQQIQKISWIDFCIQWQANSDRNVTVASTEKKSANEKEIIRTHHQFEIDFCIRCDTFSINVRNATTSSRLATRGLFAFHIFFCHEIYLLITH